MTHCRLCDHSPLEPLLNLGNHPMSHHFLREKSQTAYTHPVNLQLCTRCGLSQLVDPCPEEHLYTNYVTLSAWKKHPHIPQILDILKNEVALSASSKVVEVGSNDGSFLEVLRAEGIKNVVGIEPARDAQISAEARGILTFAGFLNTSTVDQFISKYGKADVLICRHVTEHILELKDFSKSLRKLLSPGARVYFEVPECEFFFRSLDYSSIWEQHTNYFSYTTLRRFLETVGVEVSSAHSFLFSGIVFGMVGTFTGKTDMTSYGEGRLAELIQIARNYREQFPVFKARTHEFLSEAKKQGKKIAAYGAGSRTTSFINFLDVGPFLDFIADDQPGKQNCYLPGARIPVVPSDEILARKIDICLTGVTTECEDAALKKFINNPQSKTQFYSVNPPSNRLLPVWRELLGKDAPLLREDNYQRDLE